MRRTVLAMVAVAVVAALAIGLAAGCGGGTTTYSNDEYGFSFDYDSGTFTENSDVESEASVGDAEFRIAFVDEDGTEVGDQYRDGFGVFVYDLGVNLDDFPADDVLPQLKAEIEEILPQLIEGFGSGATLGSLDDVQRDDGFAFKADSSFEIDGTPFESRMYFIFSGTTEYMLNFQAAEDRWSELEPKFEQVVDTFELGTGGAEE